MYKYKITPQLLKTITEVHLVASRIQIKRDNPLVLYELQEEALNLSSYSSTSIEGNPLPIAEVRKILKNRPDNARDSELEVLQYNDVLKGLNEEIQKKKFILTCNKIIQTHASLMKGLLPKIKLSIFRKEPVLVNNPATRKVVFWPPDHKDVSTLMEELVQFTQKEKKNLDPLIISGIFHKQFVIIHPVLDGNGRSVRLMTHALLAELGINTFSLFSFENFYHHNVSLYFQKVGEKGDYYDICKKIDFTDWLEYFCSGVLDELHRVEKLLQNSLLISPDQVLSKDQNKIIQYLTHHQFIRDKDYAKVTTRAKATRTLDFKKLIQLGYIEKLGKGPATYYQIKK